MPTPSLNATTNTLRAIRNAICNGRIPDADDQVEAMDRAIGLLDAQATAQPIGYQRKHPTEGWLTVRDEDRDYYRNQGQEIRAVYAIGKPAPDAPANEPSEKPAPAVIDSVISLLGELHTALAYNNVGNGRAKLREAIKILRDGFISVSRVSNDPVKRFSTSAIMWALDGCGLKPTPDGEWVRYSDHVAALAAQRATPPAEPVVEAPPNWNGWRSIDTAPEDCRVLLATAGNWVGEAIMLRDEDTGEQVWTWVDTGKPSLHSCYGWMPLPAPLVAPVLSDLRPDGFDGPTGAE
jgi:hypothetical protein